MKFRGTEEEAKEYKIILEEELKENIVIPIKKEKIKWYNLTFMIKKANGKWRKIMDAKALNKQIADFHFKMHHSIEVKQTIRLGELGHFTRPHLRISPPNSPCRITTIPSIRVPKQPLHIQSNAIWNQALTNILCNSNGTNNVTNKNENRDQNNQLHR
ncbi:MAG: hypothetical protein EZS28_052474 [Streblomastix strix]|uniref:Reverse transcriptase domain-containing protein n=1 Tax=Streblomastix strix TaxID=222440 RepID=A0A5J4S711_9EUKA|nr:MAG: hypothetical protein EZS28_052474 [Streblomastix strix]